jgi:Metallo-peptidase family M12B Reprolysin-like/Secretion system C-terminal sorting domain/Fibronectin type III domain/Bacterial pre-peptidase C-terminal domain
MKKLLLSLLAISMLQIVSAQQSKYWNAHSGTQSIATDKSVARLSFPKKFKLFDLNLQSLKQDLFTVVDNASSHTVVISLPNVDGQLEQFEMVEASNFEPALQARFPEIRAFSGKGITDKYATLKLSISPQGIQTMLFRTDKPNEFIEAYSQDHTVYAVFVSQRQPGQLPWSCATEDRIMSEGINTLVTNSGLTARSGGDLKTMRLAQSVTAEYSNYFGATSSAQVSLVLAGINATLTRCNGVYEKDLALHLNLIANTTSVIYYNASTDPYDAAATGAGGTWNAQLQSTLTSVIGDANYDIGHLFGASGGGGNAGCIGCVCTNGSKGSGFTSPADAIPQGDNFDIDYVVHEVGHQLGGNHTFSMSNEGTGVNVEPGSGITIMGYAGITSQDMASHSIDIYHAATIGQIQTNLAAVTCPVTTSIAANNATPVVAAVSNYTIPKSTPFALTGSATDANGDALTYCWEENDNASSSQTGASSVASATKASGPNWVSFRPTASPTRYFPMLSTILAGGLTTGPMTGGDAGMVTEALSSVARTLNFRLTVRDNAPYSSTAPIKVGQTQFTNTVVTVNATAGPFAVTVPNTAVNWAGGSTQTITWSVNSTNIAPISCANVKISLSTDGGLTFPTVLAASTPNDGTEALVIPTTPSTTARIKVEAVGNIFFDISNTNFTISGVVACGDPIGLSSSAVGNNTATVSWTAVANALSYAVDYKLNTATTWTSFSTAQTTTTANLSGLTQGSLYDWRVRATCTAGSGNYVAAQFTTTAPFVCNAPSGLSSTVTSSGATVSWTAVTGAVSYAVDYKLSTATTWTSVATASTATSVAISGLSASTLYDYRVSTSCGTNGASGFSSAQFTTSAPFVCNAPTGLTSSAISATGATVSWTAVTGAASYAVDYKLSTATTWTSAATASTATSVVISGLAATSLYDYRVSTNCGANGASGFSAAQFTTIAVSVCGTAFEPNETTATAAAITSGVVNSAAITTATDVDYFKITTTATSNIVYNLVGPAGVDYDLTIYNSAGTSVGSAATTSSTETVSLTNQAAGTYYIKVFGYSGAFSATCYTIQATATTVTSCLSTYDNATNNTANNATATAPVIPFNTNITGQISTSGDVDQYKFTITTAGTITLTLTTLPADYNLRLVNSAGTIITTSASTGTTSETINYTAAAGIYYARVYAPLSTTFNATSCYTLKVQLGTATKELYTDNSLEVFPNPVQNMLNVDLKSNKGISEIQLFDINGTQVMSKRTSSVRSQMNLSILPAGIYLMKVVKDGVVVSKTKVVKQ